MLIALVAAAPAAAIEVCRPNALGAIACSGKPTHGMDPLTPFPGQRATGLSRVQPAPGPGGVAPVIVPNSRTNALGDTLLREGDRHPPLPRPCATDGLGNLRC